MTLTVDDMLGELMAYLERTGRVENTLLVFGSDHGTQGGAQGINFWAKREPYEESIKVPLIMRLPGVFDGKPHLRHAHITRRPVPIALWVMWHPTPANR